MTGDNTMTTLCGPRIILLNPTRATCATDKFYEIEKAALCDGRGQQALRKVQAGPHLINKVQKHEIIGAVDDQQLEREDERLNAVDR